MRRSIVILFAIFSAVMLLAIACSSDEADPNATATTAPPNTVPAVDRTAEPTPAPTSTAAPVPTIGATEPSSGGAVNLAIDVNGDALQFNLATMSAAAGLDVVVTFNNSSAFNTHNWAIVEAGTKDAVATDGLTAGQGNDWLPVDDSRVIGATALIGPGASGTATFTAPSAGTYQFVCTFPGHNPTMFGDFIVN
ncbi:MAG: plastocyanin/azurin family copper-binding protein [Chloroflexi bacterium]|nr:plastocyanin/azurin family copper-binding protein [Chloroflexota bacterium]